MTAPGVAFAEARVELDLVGLEGLPLSATGRATVVAQGALAGRAQYLALLSGFDLVATGSADKPKRFALALGAVTADPRDGSLTVPVTAELDAACDTPECPLFVNTVDYRLVVDVLVVAAGDALRVTEGSFERSFGWGTLVEVAPPPVAAALQGTGGGSFPAAALALAGFELELDAYHHLLSWEQAVLPGDYDPATGVHALQLGLAFQQWQAGMKFTHLPESLLAFKAPGQATLRADVALLQLAAGEVTHGSWRGSLDWPGYGAPADTAAAVATTAVVYP